MNLFKEYNIYIKCLISKSTLVLKLSAEKHGIKKSINQLSARSEVWSVKRFIQRKKTIMIIIKVRNMNRCCSKVFCQRHSVHSKISRFYNYLAFGCKKSISGCVEDWSRKSIQRSHLEITICPSSCAGLLPSRHTSKLQSRFGPQTICD
jgi:hypothetical protein